MKRMLFVVVCAYLSTTLVGCAGTVNPSQLEPPAKGLMVPPAKLADLKAGDDLVQRHAELRRNYSTETGKLVRLQKYVRAITKK
jgi:hypothetical protein